MKWSVRLFLPSALLLSFSYNNYCKIKEPKTNLPHLNNSASLFVLVALSICVYSFSLFEVIGQLRSAVSLYIAPYLLFHFASFFFSPCFLAPISNALLALATNSLSIIINIIIVNNILMLTPGVCPFMPLFLFKYIWTQRTRGCDVVNRHRISTTFCLSQNIVAFLKYRDMWNQ